MKLLSSVLAVTSAFQMPQTPQQICNPQACTRNPGACFAKDVDIDGNLWRSNVIADIENVPNQVRCQEHCQQQRSKDCQFWVWEARDLECTLYTDLNEMEYDEDSQMKWMGPVDGCIGCHRDGWDYMVDRAPKNNLIGQKCVHSVTNVFQCSKICTLSTECFYASFHKKSGKCYLKNSDASKGIVFDEEYETVVQNCDSRNQGCVLENHNYENGYFSKYDIITSKTSGGIPGVSTPHLCHTMCQNVKECNFWTWDKDDSHCYLVKSAEYLEASSDKISGDRNCVEHSGMNHDQMNQFNQFSQG